MGALNQVKLSLYRKTRSLFCINYGNDNRRHSLDSAFIVVLTCITIFLGCCVSTSVCASVSEVDPKDIENALRNGTLSLNADTSESPTTTIGTRSNSGSHEENYDDYYSDYYDSEGNSTNKDWRKRKHDNTKIAQVIVYFSVIFIALAGVLVKYFVTQYESSQIKAQEQLNYHRLQSH